MTGREARIDRAARIATTRIMVAVDALFTMLMYELGGWTGVIVLCVTAVVVAFAGLGLAIRREIRRSA